MRSTANTNLGNGKDAEIGLVVLERPDDQANDGRSPRLASGAGCDVAVQPSQARPRLDSESAVESYLDHLDNDEAYMLEDVRRMHVLGRGDAANKAAREIGEAGGEHDYTHHSPGENPGTEHEHEHERLHEHSREHERGTGTGAGKRNGSGYR